MKVSDQLRQIADQLDQAGSPVNLAPSPRPGMVLVIPRGVFGGITKARWYPDSNADDINFWTYVTRMSQEVNPDTGEPWFPPAAVGIMSPSMGPPKPLSKPDATYPERMDFALHGEDWLTQAEIDRNAQLDLTGEHFSPTGPR